MMTLIVIAQHREYEPNTARHVRHMETSNVRALWSQGLECQSCMPITVVVRRNFWVTVRETKFRQRPSEPCH